jgi:hypothetical protein
MERAQKKQIELIGWRGATILQGLFHTPRPADSVLRACSMLPVKDFPNYLISSEGNLWSKKQKRFLQSNFSNGYRRATLFGNNKTKKRIKIHRLVLLAFKGEPQKGQVSRHLNDIKADNRLLNLTWGTRSENSKDAYRNNKQSSIGENNPNAKLTTQEVREILDLYKHKIFNQLELGRLYGITNSAISLIVLRKKWFSVHNP